MAAVQPICDRYEGFVKELVVDDKGATIVVLFGLPPQAHEDDAARCVQAALAAQQALGGAGAAHGPGRHDGRAFCGAVGSDLRREYTVVGDVMNLAARLMGRRRRHHPVRRSDGGGRPRAARLRGAARRFRSRGARSRCPVVSAAGTDGRARMGRHGSVRRERPPTRGADGRARRARERPLAGLAAGTSTVLILEGERWAWASRGLVRELLAQAAAQGGHAAGGRRRRGRAGDRLTMPGGRSSSRLLGLRRWVRLTPDARRAHVLSAAARTTRPRPPGTAAEQHRGGRPARQRADARDDRRGACGQYPRPGHAPAAARGVGKHSRSDLNGGPDASTELSAAACPGVLEDAHWLDSASLGASAAGSPSRCAPRCSCCPRVPLSEPLPTGLPAAAGATRGRGPCGWPRCGAERS